MRIGANTREPLGKLSALCLCVVLVSTMLAACTPAPTAAPPTAPPAAVSTAPSVKTKVAAVYLIPAADGGFCETLHRSLTDLAAQAGYEYEYAESVAAADAERFLRGYADRGYNVVFAHTTGYKAAVDKVAPDYPNAVFALFAGKVETPNGLLYDWYGNESCYLLGIIAGMMTKSNKVGHVGGMQVPNQLRYEGGFEAGVKAVNPQAEVISTYTGSFTDASAGKEVATSLINQGCDIVFDTMGLAWIGVSDLAREKGVYIIADYGYKSANAPDIVLAGQMVHYDKLLSAILEDRQAGTLKPEYWGSLANGICDIMYSSDADKIIPKSVMDRVEEARQAIIKGEVEVPRADLTQ